MKIIKINDKCEDLDAICNNNFLSHSLTPLLNDITSTSTYPLSLLTYYQLVSLSLPTTWLLLIHRFVVAYVCQLTRQMLWRIVPTRLVSIGICHIGEGHRHPFVRNILHHTHCAMLVARRLRGDPIGGLKLVVVVPGFIGGMVAIVDCACSCCVKAVYFPERSQGSRMESGRQRQQHEEERQQQLLILILGGICTN